MTVMENNDQGETEKHSVREKTNPFAKTSWKFGNGQFAGDALVRKHVKHRNEAGSK